MAKKQGARLPSDVLPLLNARRLPGILNSNQAAILLGLADHDTAITALAQNPDQLV
jgi:hypothetical protein